MRWNCKGSIFKNYRNCLPLGLGDRNRQKPVRRLRNPPLKLNEFSYWTFWIGCLRGARLELARWAVSAISKNDLSWFDRIFLLFDTRKSCVFQIFLLRSIKAYMCPNIITFDGVDFSERRPEEVYFDAPCISTDVLLRHTLLGKLDIELLKSMPCVFRTFKESLLQQIHSCIRLSSVLTVFTRVGSLCEKRHWCHRRIT